MKWICVVSYGLRRLLQNLHLLTMNMKYSDSRTFKGLLHQIPTLSRPYSVFKDFPGTGKKTNFFKEFQGRVATLGMTIDYRGITVQLSSMSRIRAISINCEQLSHLSNVIPADLRVAYSFVSFLHVCSSCVLLYPIIRFVCFLFYSLSCI